MVNSVNNVMISGHNNQMFGPDAGYQSGQANIILNLVVQGHNNRIENLVI